MNIVFSARKVTLTDSFKERAEAKLRKLDRFFDDVKTQVTVSAQKEIATIELTVWANNMIFRSESSNADKLEALDQAIDTMIRRIRKNKTKLLKKVKSSGFDTAEEAVLEEAAYDVIRTKEVELRPMTLDEAILQMNMLDHAFFLFINSETGATNVVYRRNEDGYGVIAAK